jgi:hypothetical protein
MQFFSQRNIKFKLLWDILTKGLNWMQNRETVYSTACFIFETAVWISVILRVGGGRHGAEGEELHWKLQGEFHFGSYCTSDLNRA